MRNTKLIVLLSVVAALVIAIVACGATFLVRHVDAYGYFENSDEYDARVVEAAAIKHNSSIFFVDEQKIKTRVEGAYANIGVVNVERKFPDRVQINYRVYGNSFQYKRGDAYYQCYASGRIGSTSAMPVGGYFTVVPKYATSDKTGEYFQSADGYDRYIISSLTEYMYSTGLNDRQIAERISFVDLSRDGYVYIRTAAGCSIELCGNRDEFTRLLDDGWSSFVDPDPDFSVSKTSGKIRVQFTRLNPDKPQIRHTYLAQGAEMYGGEIYDDDGYYTKYYVEHDENSAE